MFSSQWLLDYFCRTNRVLLNMEIHSVLYQTYEISLLFLPNMLSVVVLCQSYTLHNWYPLNF